MLYWEFRPKYIPHDPTVGELPLEGQAPSTLTMIVVDGVEVVAVLVKVRPDAR